MPREIKDAELPVSLKARLLNNGMTTDEDVMAKGYAMLIQLPRIGRKAAEEAMAWTTGEQPTIQPDIDNTLIKLWITELQAQQDRRPATSKGYREAAILAWKIGTLRSLLA